MYEVNYHHWTGILNVRGESYDIDTALDDGGLDEARKLYRKGTIRSGWSTIDNSHAPVRVTIHFKGNNYRMAIKPTFRSFSESSKRIAVIKNSLEARVDSARSSQAMGRMPIQTSTP